MDPKASIQFLGAVRTVTGSATLLEYNQYRVLIDCGMFQGPKEIREKNWSLYDKAFVEGVDAVLLTHAHVDHSAMIPKLYQLGYRGPVYCTQGTYDLATVLLPDTAYLQEEDFRRLKKKTSEGVKKKSPLYSIKDATESLQLFKVKPRNQWVELTKGLSFQFLRSGHILGSSLVQLSLSHGNGVRLVTFTGDLGNNRQNVIKGPEELFETDDLILESTYGDRIHSHISPQEELADCIQKVHKNKGVLLIPSFAVGRTQEILYMIHKVFEENRAPEIPVFLDSPMALEATDLYIKGGNDLKDRIIDGQLNNPLCPPRFERIKKLEDSIRLMSQKGPMIILSAAGMLTGGRVLYHLKKRLPDPHSILLFVGYQAEDTKGRLLQQGLKSIRIHKEWVAVKAEVKTIDSLSAHADSDEIIDWVSHIEKKPKNIFINHGDLSASKALAYRIRYELGLDVKIPLQNEVFKLF